MDWAVLHDIRYGVRSLRLVPGFSLIVLVTLAVGIGANAALYSLLNAVVLRRLPVQRPEQLAALSITDQRGVGTRSIYVPAFEELVARQHVFETATLYAGGFLLTTESHDSLALAGVEGVTPTYYDVLGIRPYLGRVIGAADVPTLAEGAPVAVLSYEFWQRVYAGDRHVLGQILKVSGVPLTIIGVTPPGFAGLQIDGGIDFAVPLGLLRQLTGDPKRPVRGNSVIGRLRAGVTLTQAQREIGTLWPAVVADTPIAGQTPAEQDARRSERAHIESASTGFSLLRRSYASALFLLVGLAAIVLLVACVNLSGLLLVRAMDRHQQVLIRLALGASRARLAQHVLIESLLLSIGGTAAALPVAWIASRFIGTTLWASPLRLALTVTPDRRVLALMVVVALGVGLLIGAVPAWFAARDPAHVRLTSVRSAARSGRRWGHVLLVTQIALSLILLFGAGLFGRSLSNIRSIDFGFRTSGVLWSRVTSQPSGYRGIVESTYYPELVRRLSEVQGVQSVALSRMFPAYFDFPRLFETVGQTYTSDRAVDVRGLPELVSPRFFETFGMTRLQGRDFSWSDDSHATPVAIINVALSRKMFPADNPIGRQIATGKGAAHISLQIVGVVDDASIGDLREPHTPVVFRPWLQDVRSTPSPTVSIRTIGDLQAAGDATRQTIASLGREYVMATFRLDEQVDRALRQERLVAGLSSLFAALAVFLACLGIYGFLAYGVARRARDIGIRMALGATRRSVLMMTLREGLWVAVMGVGLGIPSAVAAGRFVSALLFGLSANDLSTLIVASAVFIAIATTAGLLPAYRAATTDPIQALRQD